MAKTEAWLMYYNESRRHSALGWLTPAEFAHQCGLQAAFAKPEKADISTSECYWIGARVREAHTLGNVAAIRRIKDAPST